MLLSKARLDVEESDSSDEIGTSWVVSGTTTRLLLDELVAE